MIQAVPAERIGGMKIHATFWLESLKGRDYLEDLGVDGKVI
jgi:hypothetical protein